MDARLYFHLISLLPRCLNLSTPASPTLCQGKPMCVRVRAYDTTCVSAPCIYVCVPVWGYVNKQNLKQNHRQPQPFHGLSLNDWTLIIDLNRWEHVLVCVSVIECGWVAFRHWLHLHCQWEKTCGPLAISPIIWADLFLSLIDGIPHCVHLIYCLAHNC